MELRDKLYNRRKELGLTLEQVGDIVGVGKSTVRKWETGDISNMKRDKIAMLANALQVSPGFIMGWEESNLKAPEITDNIVTFPIIGEIAAGYESIAVEDWSGDTISIPQEYLRGRKQDEFFVLSVHGDSMYPLYMDGDKVLILKQSTLNRSGDIGAVMYDDEHATLKKVEYVMGEDWMNMIPINPEYQPKRKEGADLESCRVLGIPWVLIRDLQ